MKPPRVIPDDELARLFSALDTYAAADRGSVSLGAVRDRALYRVALGSGLRLSECLALDVDDVVRGRGQVVSRFLLPASKAKGGERGEGYAMVGRRARGALRAYLSAAAAAGWVERGQGPLWRTSRQRATGPWPHPRLGKRAAQSAFSTWQRRGDLHDHWRWHDMRHTAITRFASTCNGDAFKVAAFARHRDLRSTLRYVYGNPDELQQLAEGL